ncbi:MAG TPA: helix-turn-helix transcriptional regulator [Candidatus Acidoferrum sp.]
MVARNKLLAAPPYPVEQALKNVGRNLRSARLRREQTIQQVAKRIGTGPRAVRDAESGKASTGVAVYAALLWAYDLLDSIEKLADPLTDKEGLALAAVKEGKRARKSRDIDNEF